MFFLGQNPSRRPTRKILSADKIKSPLLERPAVSERKGEIQDNLIFNFQFSINNMINIKAQQTLVKFNKTDADMTRDSPLAYLGRRLLEVKNEE